MENIDKLNYMTHNPLVLPMSEVLKQQEQSQAFNQQITNLTQYPANLASNEDLNQDQEMPVNNGGYYGTNVSTTLESPQLTTNTSVPLSKPELTGNVDPKPPIYSPEMSESQKRKSPVDTNTDANHLAKKQQLSQLAEEKKKTNLRKNIREVMDTNQLDTNTLRAQHEESERLARMAEQQKLLREYQQREAVLTHFDRFVNEHRVRDPSD